MFEQATKLKLRFDSAKGQLTVEDLWDLPLSSKNGVSLDTVAMNIHAEIGETNVKSFVSETPTVTVNVKLELKLDIVKHIIEVIKEDNARERNAKANKALRQKVLAIKADRRDKALYDASDEELDALLNQLK